MNTSIINKDVLLSIYRHGYFTQRKLSADSGLSLGTVNNAIKELTEAGFLNNNTSLTDKALSFINSHTPESAIILAAGYGMRMVPINTDTPKGLLTVHGEVLIERTIRQLQAAGVKKIYIVVGYMKESYAYLIDEFGVELIINTDYHEKNNLHSLAKACSHISNSYIIPCDIWCRENPYTDKELYSWYMVSDVHSDSSTFHINRKKELTETKNGGHKPIGIAYISSEDSEKLTAAVREMCSKSRYNTSFWENALFDKGSITLGARLVRDNAVVEINTYEQLRELDSLSSNLQADSINIICESLHVNADDIINITSLKKGMTNRSFLFECRNKRYIMRIPGEGTSQLINRRDEAHVYSKIQAENICDNIIYINPENGYKLTEYIENARTCNPENMSDVNKCMQLLRSFHNMDIQVHHEFDIFAHLEYYESLWKGKPSIYKDYRQTKANVLKLKAFIDNNVSHRTLTHIDAVPDNFLFYIDNNKESIRMIDWEYAGMADPHTDLAMFSIYSFYDKAQIDNLINCYFPEGCSRETIIKIYCYVAVCGLLWSNWCEYKLSLGVEFGEYSIRQYRYAVDFFRIAKKELNEIGIEI